MGDLIQSLGAVPALRACAPDWRLTLVTQREWLPLLEGFDGIDRVVPFDRRGGLRALRALRRELRTERYEHALDLQGNWKSALIARLSGAASCIGMAASWRQEPRSRWLLRRTIACDATPHPARAAWELVKQLVPRAPFASPQLFATDAEQVKERDVLASIGIDAGRPFRVVIVTDSADPRALRPEFVAAEMRQGGAPSVLVLGPEESAIEPPVEGPVVRHAKGELRRLVALGALVAAAGGEVVGPDQGATHVLLAAGAGGRVYFGSQDPRRTAPPAARCFVAADPPSCQPCRQRVCRNPAGVVCMPLEPEAAREVSAGLPPWLDEGSRISR